jgi:hypothetical protein
MEKQNNITVTEAKKVLRGRAYQYFCGWNGMFRQFIITNVRNSKGHKGYYELMGHAKGNDDFRYEITIDAACLKGLCNKGEYKEYNEIDHCPFTVSHSILN